MGDQSTAIELGTQALALCEEIGDDDRRIRVLGNLGAASSEAGDFEASQAYLEAQIALARELGVDVEDARATYNLGLLLLRRGDIEGGAEQLERAKVKVDRLGHKMGVMYCLAAIGRARLDLGDLEQACANYVAAIELGIETGHDALSIDPVEELAIVAGEVGEREIGADLLATAAHFREIYGSQTSAIEQERVAAAREQLGLDSQQIDAAVLSLEGCLGHARSLSTRASEVSSRHARGAECDQTWLHQRGLLASND